MRQHTCTNCHKPIPLGGAVLRSHNLRLVAFHRECHDEAQAVRVEFARIVAGCEGSTSSPVRQTLR